MREHVFDGLAAKVFGNFGDNVGHVKVGGGFVLEHAEGGFGGVLGGEDDIGLLAGNGIFLSRACNGMEFVRLGRSEEKAWVSVLSSHLGSSDDDRVGDLGNVTVDVCTELDTNSVALFQGDTGLGVGRKRRQVADDVGRRDTGRESNA